MKRTLAWILVVATLVCMLPAFAVGSVAAEDDENQYGLNADYYQLEGILNYHQPYTNALRSGTGADATFGDSLWFDETIETLTTISIKVEDMTATNITTITSPNNGPSFLPDYNAYYLKWEGTITSATGGTYYFVGNKIDNGFVAFVDQDGEDGAEKKVFEYWSSHYFDGGNDYLYSDTSFTLEAGVPTDVVIYYLEVDGGQALNILVSEVPDGGAENAKSFEAAGLTLNLNQEGWRCNIRDNDHNMINQYLEYGYVNADTRVDTLEAKESNGCDASLAGNHQFADTYEDIKSVMWYMGTTVVDNYESASYAFGKQFGLFGDSGLDDAMIEYTGYITSTKGGVYEFGTRAVDNCLSVQIKIDDEWVTAYEFWARAIWNDNSETFAGTTVTLEKGKSYPIRVVFLEINGGNAVESRFKIDGSTTSVSLAESNLVFTTEPLKTIPISEYFFGTGAEWHYMTSGEANDQVAPEGWTTDAAIYGTWSKANANLGEGGSNVWQTDGSGSKNKSLWAVKEFTVEDLDAIGDLALAMNINYDDNICLYVNGKLVYQEYYWSSGSETWKIANKASDLLVEGTNVIAVSLIQGHGGYGFDMGLYVTNSIPASDPATYITNVDEFFAFVDAVNAAGNKGADLAVVLGADLDFTDETWTPIAEFKGQIYGNGHSIKNITYTSTGTDIDRSVLGMFVNVLTHDGSDRPTAIIDGIVFDGCEFNTAGVTVGLVAGLIDRSLVRNVTIKNSVINNEGKNAAAIAGDAKWGCALKHIVGCTVENTEVTATETASGLAVYIESGAEMVEMENNTLTNVTLNAPKQYADVSNKNGNITVTNLVVNSELSAPAEGDYTFYYQTRSGVDGTTDYRIICVANTEWVTSQSEIKVELSFTNGTDTVTKTESATVAYETITAKGDGYTDVYTPAEGNVIFGWVVTGVPADYAKTAPTATVVD